jgi:hypothetical protein
MTSDGRRPKRIGSNWLVVIVLILVTDFDARAHELLHDCGDKTFS